MLRYLAFALCALAAPAFASITSESEDNDRESRADGPVSPGIAVTGSLSSRRDIDWLTELQNLAAAIGGSDKLHFTSFEANVASRTALAVVNASGRARSREDVQALYDRIFFGEEGGA